MERKLQRKIIVWLKENKCYVIKTRPGMGTPVGCPDVVFVRGQKWGVIEVKAAENSPYQAGQEATLDYLKSQNPYVYRAYPENWEQIKLELSSQFF